MPITIAPYPAPSVRTSLPSSEWDSITSVYLTATSHLLHLPQPQFLSETSNSHSISAFLLSYISHADPDAATSGSANDQLLRKKVFQLLHRLLTQSPKPPKDLFASDRFLFGLARCYGRSTVCRALLKELWKKQEEAMSTAVGKQKAHLCPQLAAGLLSNETVSSLCRLFLLSPETAAAWCAGDELWEAAAEAEDKTAIKVAGRAALEAVKFNWSVVTDALLALLSSKARQQKALIEGLVKFGVVERLQMLANDTEAEGRIAKIAERVKDMEVMRIRKEKGKERAADTIDWREEARVELESKVGAIRDLFPELGAGFVKRALEVLGGDVEVVTSALLEGNLPPDLDKLDRGLQERYGREYHVLYEF